MKTKKGRTKWRVGTGELAAVFVAAVMAGCGGGGSGSFVDQNGTQVIGPGEPSEELRWSVAYVITDPSQEPQTNNEELGALPDLAPLLREEAAPDGTGPAFDKKLGLYLERIAVGQARRVNFYTDAALKERVGYAIRTRREGGGAFFPTVTINTQIEGGALARTSGYTSVSVGEDTRFFNRFKYTFERALSPSPVYPSETGRDLLYELEGSASRDLEGRVETNAKATRTETSSDHTVPRRIIDSTSRVIRRLDRSGERRGTYTFNGSVITVTVTYGPGGTGTGRLTGTANGLPATIAVGERITSVKYADGTTIETFDRPQVSAEFFN